MLAQNSDMVLLAARRDHSRIPYLVQSRDALQSLNVPLLGAVMVGADSDLQRDTYGYSQGVTRRVLRSGAARVVLTDDSEIIRRHVHCRCRRLFPGVGIRGPHSAIGLGSLRLRIERSTQRVLEIAASAGTTERSLSSAGSRNVFHSSWRDIQDAGHEIGCHSMSHQLVYDLGPDGFRDDLIAAHRVLEDATGQAVRLYRAPSFSITRRSLWALEILAEEGFETDSSIYPIHHDRYGIPSTPARPYRIATSAGFIREFPGMVCELAGTKIPVGGGGYLRLFPWAITRRLLHRVRAQNRPLNVYIHPWEFDPDQPRLAGSIKSRFRHYQNLSSTATKIEYLLSEFSLTTMSAVLDAIDLPECRALSVPSEQPLGSPVNA